MRELPVLRVISISRRDAVEVGERDEVARRIVLARLGERLIGESLRDRLVEQVEDILRGVQVLVRQRGQVAQRVIAVSIRVVRRVGMVELDDGLQLVCGIVSVPHDRARRIGDAGQVARAIVAVGGGGAVGIDRLDQALAGVVLEGGGVAVAVGAGDAVARGVVGVGEVALRPGDGRETARRVVDVSGGVVERVGLGVLAAVVVVGERGGAGLRRVVALGDGGLAAGEIVDVVGDVAGLVGLVDDIVAEVVGLGRRSDGICRIGRDGQPVQRVVLIRRDVAARVRVGGLVAIGVVGGAGDSAQRRRGLGQVAEGVVGVGGGRRGRAACRSWEAAGWW